MTDENWTGYSYRNGDSAVFHSRELSSWINRKWIGQHTDMVNMEAVLLRSRR